MFLANNVINGLNNVQNNMSGRDMFLKTVLSFMYYIMFFQKSQKSIVNKAFKNFYKTSQNRDWEIVMSRGGVLEDVLGLENVLEDTF